MDFRVLGPIEARARGVGVTVGGGRQKALLALLVMHAGEVVSRDRLLEDLWGGEPPPAAGRSLDAYVSRLRRAFREAGAGEVLETRAPGYLLRADAIDADRFEALAAGGRAALAAGDAAAAAQRLRTGLALWRGRAYLEVVDEPWARTEADRLEESRLSAVEDRIEADLALGRHAAVAPELEALVARHPRRERLVGQFMLALYRCGRQTEALETFRIARAALVEELGIEPGPALRRLETAVLRHDPALDPPAAEPPADAAPAGRRGRGWRAAVGILALAAVVAVVVAVLGGSDPRQTLAADSAGAVDPVHGRVVASVPVGAESAAIAVADGRIWIADGARDTVSRIDPRGEHVEQTLPVGSAPVAMVAGAGALWIANARGGTLSRVDPRAGTVVQTIPAGTHPSAIAFGAGAVWVADGGGGEIVAVDPRTGAVRRRIGLSGQPAGVAVGFGSIWVTEPLRRRLVRLDPRSGAIADELDAGGGAGPVAVGAGAVWVLNRLDGTLSRVDPTTDTVSATVPVGAAPTGLAAGADGAWVTDAAGLVAVDARPGTLPHRFALGAAPTAVTLLAGRPWVTTGVPAGREHRGGTLRVVTSDDLSLVDPAQFDGIAPGIWRALGDGLLALTDDGGVAQLVPDLAVALPRPTAGGRAYAFRLRSGIRYGTGVPLRASDFRRAFERLFASGSPSARLYEALAGAGRCGREPARCDLSRGVVTDDRAGTVVLRLTRPDPLLPFRLTEPAARPVPPGTLQRATARRTVASTGPYRVARLVPGRELDLERNPHFLPWSRAAQPDGYPDRIELRFDADTDGRVRAVQSNRADVAIDVSLARSLRDLETRFASQLRPHAQPLSIFYTLNVRRPPFTDVRARRALNLAIDRAALARRFGGRSVSSPICQLLPSGIPGHVDYCPWTRGPLNGRWHGVDLRRARALVRASGTAGAQVRFVARGDDLVASATATALATALREIGYRPRIMVTRNFMRFGTAIARGDFEVSLAGWISDFPSASEFFEQFLRCAAYDPRHPTRTTNSGGWCDPPLDRLVARAEAAEVADPLLGKRIWARAERRTVDLAPLVPAITARAIELVSPRAEHFTLDADSQLRLDQLWVR